MKAPITVVIPARLPVDANLTVNSLAAQTVVPERVIVVPDIDRRGANYVRNQGFRLVETEFVLFSDDDIEWQWDALETLLKALKEHPEASYSYGAYEMDNCSQCAREFDAQLLKRHNYISTMSLIRAADFAGFDEKIGRLQDWDLWLTMLEQGKTGVYCGKLIFRTNKREGITYAKGSLSYPAAWTIVAKKHGLG